MFTAIASAEANFCVHSLEGGVAISSGPHLALGVGGRLTALPSIQVVVAGEPIAPFGVSLFGRWPDWVWGNATLGWEAVGPTPVPRGGVVRWDGARWVHETAWKRIVPWIDSLLGEDEHGVLRWLDGRASPLPSVPGGRGLGQGPMLTPGNVFVRTLEPATLGYQYWRFRAEQLEAQPFEFPHGSVEVYTFAGNRTDLVFATGAVRASRAKFLTVFDNGAWRDLPLPHQGAAGELCVTQAGNVFLVVTSGSEGQIYLLSSGERWERVTPAISGLNGAPPLVLTAGANGDVWLVARCVPQSRITSHLYHASA
jgi:hypothetical protein